MGVAAYRLYHRVQHKSLVCRDSEDEVVLIEARDGAQVPMSGSGRGGVSIPLLLGCLLVSLMVESSSWFQRENRPCASSQRIGGWLFGSQLRCTMHVRFSADQFGAVHSNASHCVTLRCFICVALNLLSVLFFILLCYAALRGRATRHGTIVYDEFNNFTVSSPFFFQDIRVIKTKTVQKKAFQQRWHQHFLVECHGEIRVLKKLHLHHNGHEHEHEHERENLQQQQHQHYININKTISINTDINKTPHSH